MAARAAVSAPSFPMQIVDGDGVFNVAGLERFVEDVRLRECGVSYTIVSIMGPQSSGKSTLLNHLFHTSFREMDADDGRSQTTKGIWMARGVGIEPCTLLMDLEGSDGRERGQDDTAFERQSALFALAISDVVLVNMWCHDIGREQAANKPLLRTVFQVMTRLFTPRKTTLLFVIRDKTRSPFEKLESILRQDIQKIWDSVPKSGVRQGTALSKFFDVQVVALPSFEEKAVQFVEEVARLRQRFSHSMAPGGLTSDRWGVVHASGFSINARQIWEHIKEDKDLDLPSLTVMVSTIRCEEIAQDKFRRFLRNEVWRRLEEDARSGPMPNLGSELTAIINACLSGYEKEAIHFNEDVRISWRKQLDEKLLNLVQPAVRSVLGHLSSRTLGMFKQEFDEALSQGEGFSSAARNCFSRVVAHFDIECTVVTIKRANWDVSKEKEELRHNMRTHIGSLKAEKVAKLIHAYKAKLDDMLAGSVEAPLVNANDETWSSVRNLLQRAISSAIDDFTSATHDFEIDEPDKRNMLAELRRHAIGVVETKTRELARKVLILMKERFSILFFPVNNSMRRILTGKENFGTITVAARSASLKLLAVMAAVRLDNKADNMERTLSVALLANHSSTSTIGYGDSTLGSLVSDNWDGIPTSRTLITPIQCESLWRQFIEETKCIVTQAFSVQVKVAEALCEEISNKSFLAFSKDEDWLKLKKAAHKGPVPDFGWKISSMIRACLFRYEMETKNFDKAARRSKQLQLKQNLLHLAQPSFQYVLGRMRCDTLCDFQEAFDKALPNGKGFSSIARDCTGHYMALFDEKCIGARIEQAQWDTSVFSEDLQRDMDAHVASVQDRKVYELVEACKGKLNDALSGPVETLLDGANNETWSSIRKLLHRETDYAVSGFYDALSSFEMDEQAGENMLANLRDHAKRVVEEKAREGAERVLFLMKDRFSRFFFLDDDSMLRAWTGKEDVVAITQGARSASLKSLSVLAAVRLDDVADNIEGTLSASFLYDHCTFSANDTSNSFLASSAPDTWEEVPPTRTLLTPANCEALWKQFIQETENMVARALLSPAGCS